MEKVKLGDRVRDELTGLTGIVVCISDWLWGCRRVIIQPREIKDGKPVDTFSVDEPQLTVLETGVIGESSKEDNNAERDAEYPLFRNLTTASLRPAHTVLGKTPRPDPCPLDKLDGPAVEPRR
jgi:hypothetical protein